MNVVRKLTLIAALALATPLHAQVCSGGKDGGTDPTGNQCTDPTSAAIEPGSPMAAANPSASATVTSLHRRSGLRSAAPSAQRPKDAIADASFSRAQR